jgi:hypothetical protein
MKTMSFATAALASLAIAAPAGAAETITTNLTLSSFPASPPFVQTYAGTFTAAGTVGDSGTVTVRALFGALPAPSTGVFETERALTGAAGTLELRCSEIAKDFSNESAVPGSGTCAVLGASGAYTVLAGAGRANSVVNLNTGSFSDTLQLP